MIYSGNKFIIRTWKEGDEPFLAHSANNKNIWRYLDNKFPYPYTYDDALCFINQNLKSDNPLNFALVVDDEPIGNIGMINEIGVDESTVRIEYWLSEEYWGQGIMTEAVAWLVEYVFKNNTAKDISAQVFSNNEASKRVLIKNGFSLEVIQEKSINKDGLVLDELVYSISE